jgi:predicted transcriptional regulator
MMPGNCPDGRFVTAYAGIRNHVDTFRYITPQQTTDECMALMTEHRLRYLPVIVTGEVIGKVSIGDLVKNLIADQETRSNNCCVTFTATPLSAATLN